MTCCKDIDITGYFKGRYRYWKSVNDPSSIINLTVDAALFQGDAQNPIDSTEEMLVDHAGGKLKFVRLKKEFEGPYRCAAINDAGSAESRGFLKVIGKD